DPEADPDAAAPAKLTLRRITIQVVGFAVGVALIVWCVRTATKDGDWERVRHADWRLGAGLVGGRVGGHLANGFIFWSMIRPVRRIPALRLLLLNVVASFLNFAPVRLGVVARIVHHVRVDRFGPGIIAAWFGAVALVMFSALGACAVAALAL